MVIKGKTEQNKWLELFCSHFRCAFSGRCHNELWSASSDFHDRTVVADNEMFGVSFWWLNCNFCVGFESPISGPQYFKWTCKYLTCRCLRTRYANGSQGSDYSCKITAAIVCLLLPKSTFERNISASWPWKVCCKVTWYVFITINYLWIQITNLINAVYTLLCKWSFLYRKIVTWINNLHWLCFFPEEWCKPFKRTSPLFLSY